MKKLHRKKNPRATPLISRKTCKTTTTRKPRKLRPTMSKKVRTIKMTMGRLPMLSPEGESIVVVVEAPVVIAAVTQTSGVVVTEEAVATGAVPELLPTRTMKDSSPRLATRSPSIAAIAEAVTVATEAATGKAVVAASAVIEEAEAKAGVLTVAVRARMSKTRLSTRALRRPNQKLVNSEVEARFV